MTNWILDILFPKKCVGCKKEGSYFCGDCVGNILQTNLVCPICEKQAMGGQTHPICQKRFGLDGLWSLGIYGGALQKAIKQLKYQRASDLSSALVDILVEYWAKYQPFILDQITKDQGQGWVVIGVPLYWWRENSRGFNQAAVIGQIFSKKLGLAYCDGLKRIHHTTSQVRLKGWERRKNIRNAFKISSSFKPETMNSVLLIDDVWTTGSTLKECCYILKRNGAKKVWAITLAR